MHLPHGERADVARLIAATAIPDERTGCWVYPVLRKSGYGRLLWMGDDWRAHRASVEAFHGEIGESLEVDHLCRNKACVNPSHLEVVTHAENMRRYQPFNAHRQKTHCKAGHSYAGDNLYITPTTGARQCLACMKERKRARRAAMKCEVVA